MLHFVVWRIGCYQQPSHVHKTCSVDNNPVQLTNSEVLEVLKDRKADTDNPILPSETQVCSMNFIQFKNPVVGLILSFNNRQPKV